MNRVLHAAPELTGTGAREVGERQPKLVRRGDVGPLATIIPAIQQEPVRMRSQPGDPALDIGSPETPAHQVQAFRPGAPWASRVPSGRGIGTGRVKGRPVFVDLNA